MNGNEDDIGIGSTFEGYMQNKVIYYAVAIVSRSDAHLCKAKMLETITS